MPVLFINLLLLFLFTWYEYLYLQFIKYTGFCRFELCLINRTQQGEWRRRHLSKIMGYVQFTSEILLRISEAPDTREVAPWAINSESILLRAARTHNLIPPLETVVDNMRVSKMPEPEYHGKYSSIMTKKLSKQQGSSHWERTEFWEVCEAGWRESAVKTELTLPQKNKRIFERTKNSLADVWV